VREEKKEEEQEEPEDEYDGKLSEHECPKQLRELPKCSSRILTARKPNRNDRSIGSKVQCNILLEQTFFVLFNDLKLLSSLENWE
jgi:hypothetical protein